MGPLSATTAPPINTLTGNVLKPRFPKESFGGLGPAASLLRIARDPPSGHLAHQFPCRSTLDDDKTATGMRARACGYLLVLPSHGTKQTPEAIPWGLASTMYIDPETESPLPLPTLLSRLRPNSWNSSIAPPYKGRNGRSAHRALPRGVFEPLQSTHHAGPHRSPAYGARAG